jgi:hypothetical protein
MARFGPATTSELMLLLAVKRKREFRARQGQFLAQSGRSQERPLLGEQRKTYARIDFFRC